MNLLHLSQKGRQKKTVDREEWISEEEVKIYGNMFGVQREQLWYCNRKTEVAEKYLLMVLLHK